MKFKTMLPHLLIASTMYSFTAKADVIDFIDDTFDVSFTTDADGDFYATLGASHNVSDSWRIFGEYTTTHHWELGVGYNFMAFDSIYNEVTIKAVDTHMSTVKPTIGLFSAGYITSNTIMYTNLETGYSHGELGYYQGVDFNKSVGFMYEATPFLDLGYAINHDKGYHKLSVGDITAKFDDAMVYHEVSATVDIHGVKPSVTYTMGDFTHIEFGLSFDF